MARHIENDSKCKGRTESGGLSAPSINRLLAILSTVSLAISLLLLVAAGASAQESADDESGRDSEETATTAPLVVPVYPRGTKTEDAPIGTDLQDSYIIMKDGSALSVADWILGSLKKDSAGADMSDYESRLFLGQVARAMVGMDETLVRQNYVYLAPTVGYRPPPPPKGAMRALQAVTGLITSALLPGTPSDWHPAKSGGAFSPMMKSGGDAAILFEEQFHNALMQTAGDFKEQGTMRIMLEEAQRKQSVDD